MSVIYQRCKVFKCCQSMPRSAKHQNVSMMSPSTSRYIVDLKNSELWEEKGTMLVHCHMTVVRKTQVHILDTFRFHNASFWRSTIYLTISTVFVPIPAHAPITAHQRHFQFKICGPPTKIESPRGIRLRAKPGIEYRKPTCN